MSGDWTRFGRGFEALRQISIEASELRRGDIIEWKGNTYAVQKVAGNITNRKVHTYCPTDQAAPASILGTCSLTFGNPNSLSKSST